MEAGYREICITGATLPTIRDGIDWGDVVNARSSVNASLHERTQLTLEFNAKLSSLADRLGLYYFDLTDLVIDRDSMLVNDYFREKDPANHHLDFEKVAALWANKCNQFLSYIEDNIYHD